MSLTKLQSIILEKIKNDPEAQKAFEERISSGTSLVKLAEYFNVNPNTMLKEESAKKIRVAYDIINETYSKLSPIEKDYVSLVTSRSKNRVYNQVKIVESLISGLKSLKEKELATECLTVLKADILKRPLTEAIERTLDLKQTITSLLEADEYHGGVITKKLGNLKYLKDIRLAVLHDEKDAPETLYITFKTAFFPLGNDFSSVKASLVDLDKRFGRMGRNILNQTIHQKGRAGEIFTGEGIWDGGVRIHSVKPGGMSEGSGELTLHVVKGSLTSIEDAKKALVPILRDLDLLIPTWFPETDKAAQKQYMKTPDEGDTERLAQLKRQASRLKEPERSDEFGGAF